MQSSTAGNNGAPTPVPLSLGHALYFNVSLFRELYLIFFFKFTILCFEALPVMYVYAEVEAGLLTQQPLQNVTYLASRNGILQIVYCDNSFV
jgi:hypothetical protein